MEDFNHLLKAMKSADVQKSFESKQERINYFKTQSKTADINSLFSLLKLLKVQDDLGSVEVQIQNRVLDSIALEYSVISNIDITTAKDEIKALL